MRYVFGIDVGGTTIKCGLFDDDANILDKWEIVTRKEDHGNNILPDVAKTVLDKIREKNIDPADVEGIGLDVPGNVNDHGCLTQAVNIGWGEKNIVEELEKLTGLTVKAANDANAAALGEMWKGAAKGYDSVIMLTLGTGVGGGIIVGGKIIAGYTGSGGEVGHIHVTDKLEEKCNCGNCGCLEQVASATGIYNMAKRYLAESDEPSMLRGTDCSAKAVYDAAKKGDPMATRIADHVGRYLGFACSCFACVTNPQVFVIGGGVSKAGPILLEPVIRYYEKYAFVGVRGAKFVLAELGNDAGIYGAAKLILG